jgi:hypothetical protein
LGKGTRSILCNIPLRYRGVELLNWWGVITKRERVYSKDVESGCVKSERVKSEVQKMDEVCRAVSKVRTVAKKKL